jgi:hypothetical protein
MVTGALVLTLWTLVWAQSPDNLPQRLRTELQYRVDRLVSERIIYLWLMVVHHSQLTT